MSYKRDFTVDTPITVFTMSMSIVQVGKVMIKDDLVKTDEIMGVETFFFFFFFY